MAGVLAAQRAYKDAQREARELVARAHARLGLEVVRERQAGTKQDAIARKLCRTREQVRRYEQAYRDWVKDHEGESLEDDELPRAS